MEKLIDLEIVSPESIVYNGKIKNVSVPGIMGLFQILFNHAPMVSVFEIGKIKVVDAENNELSFATSGGILEVRNNKVIILADTCESKDKIDVERAQIALDRAKSEFTKDNKDLTELRHAILRAKNRIKISKS